MNSATGASRTDSADASASKSDQLSFRQPCEEDGPAVTALIAACPPLDANSAYCNLLQCGDFAGTCVIVEQGSAITGWISAYRPPGRPHELFIWQVAVAATARGQGLAGRMLDALLARPSMQGVTHIVTTVTADNGASRAMFRRFAQHRGAALDETLRFDERVHFGGAHASEWQLRIGPIHSAPPAEAGRTTRETATS